MLTIRILVIVSLILAGFAYAQVDSDGDGFFEDRPNTIAVDGGVDRCPNTEYNAEVDGYGCSCMQKAAVGCTGPQCCAENTDPCAMDCAVINYRPTCTAGTGINACSDTIYCGNDNCKWGNDGLFYDYPDPDYRRCVGGVCQPFTCAPVVTPSDRCSFNYCQTTYGSSFFCGGYIDFVNRCNLIGTQIGIGRECQVTGAPLLGQCYSCETSCSDTCLSLGYRCGTQSVCSQQRDCGTCQAGYACDAAGQCQPTCTDSCSSLGYRCGQHTICGRLMDCGTCGTGQQCSSAGICQASCTDTCQSLGLQCGQNSVCGQQRDCGTCQTGYVCSNNRCVQSCTDTCQSLGLSCGTQTICGQQRDCGTCPTGQQCVSGSCVQVCSDSCQSLGYSCGTQTICGQQQDCGTCQAGFSCQNGYCIGQCTDTCQSLGYECGVHTICGQQQDCGACQVGTCNYDGFCVDTCQDTCESISLHCGTQTICGRTADCGACASGLVCQNGQCVASCQDSDRNDYTIKGTVTNSQGTATDYCVYDTLIELSCGPGGERMETEIDCGQLQQRCDDGRCVQQEPSALQGECSYNRPCVQGLNCTEDWWGPFICCPPNTCAGYGNCQQEGTVISETGTANRYRCNGLTWVNYTFVDYFRCTQQSARAATTMIAISGDGHVSLPSYSGFITYLNCEASQPILASGTLLFSVSDPPQDAHISLFDNFPNKVYAGFSRGSVACSIRDSCNTDESCLFSIYGPRNDAHVGSCGSVREKLCCKYSSSLPGEPVVTATYDGTGVRVQTNLNAACTMTYNGARISIPCTDASCTDHYIATMISGNVLINCGQSEVVYVSACTDGTPEGRCSADRFYCNNGRLTEDCRTCGCAQGSCNAQNRCAQSSCTSAGIGTGPSAALLDLADPVVASTAQKALNEYAARYGRPAVSEYSPSEIMEAVAMYVDAHMGYVAETTDYAQSAAETIKSSRAKCSMDYCGDCEDFAILRLALMRSLGVSPECAFSASNADHTFNIVQYGNAFRIMDYGMMGRYYYLRQPDHDVGYIWNDQYGQYGYGNTLHTTMTWNYPSGLKCPTTYSFDTYYKDTCP